MNVRGAPAAPMPVTQPLSPLGVALVLAVLGVTVFAIYALGFALRVILESWGAR